MPNIKLIIKNDSNPEKSIVLMIDFYKDTSKSFMQKLYNAMEKKYGHKIDQEIEVYFMNNRYSPARVDSIREEFLNNAVNLVDLLPGMFFPVETLEIALRLIPRAKSKLSKDHKQPIPGPLL